MAQIFLVRHGRSAHVHRGLVDLAGFARWREAYEAAGIDERDQPPPELTALAATSGILVSSPAARAMQSARRLDGEREITTSPLLEELELAPPGLRRVRMPLIGWALAIGIGWAIRSVLRRPRVAPAELQRARDAAEWLSGLTRHHDAILVVTHASFRSLLAEQLIARGWHCEVPGKRSRHWSVWRLQR
jgi:phosphohistidine phosphatase SixA